DGPLAQGLHHRAAHRGSEMANPRGRREARDGRRPGRPPRRLASLETVRAVRRSSAGRVSQALASSVLALVTPPRRGSAAGSAPAAGAETGPRPATSGWPAGCPTPPPPPRGGGGCPADRACGPAGPKTRNRWAPWAREPPAGG